MDSHFLGAKVNLELWATVAQPTNMSPSKSLEGAFSLTFQQVAATLAYWEKIRLSI
jgi:hypothetical protein